MPNARQIKQRIKTARNIAKITKAMEMVSASKMRKAQEQALSARPYSVALRECLSTVAQYTDPKLHDFFQAHDEGSDVAVVLTTNRGLCGNLNSAVLKQALAWQATAHDPQFIVVGKKGLTFLKSSDLTVSAAFTQLPEIITFADTLAISSLCMEGFIDRSIRSVTLIYTDFISTLSQKPTVVPLLPIAPSSKDPEPENKSEIQNQLQAKEFDFEPSAKEILSQLLPAFVENTVYQSFLESKASEHSARMVSMKNASENANELVSDLSLIYNKSRQASITGELLDITTAILAQQ